MHEYGLTERIVRIAVETAEREGAGSVASISLVIGESSGVIIDSLQMYFEMIAAGTRAEKARLRIRTVKPEMRCPECGINFVRPRFSFNCPVCGALGNPTDVGREFYIESVELDV